MDWMRAFRESECADGVPTADELMATCVHAHGACPRVAGTGNDDDVDPWPWGLCPCDGCESWEG